VALYKGEKASLAVRTPAAGGVKMNIKNGRIPYHIFSARTPQPPPNPAILDLQTTGKSNAAQFLVGLVPARTDGDARALASKMTEVKSGRFLGLRTRRGDETDLVMFRVGTAGGAGSYESWTTDADSWTVTQSRGKTKLFAVQNARSFAQSGKIFLTAEKPVSLAANYDENGVNAAAYAAAAANVRLYVGANPVRVLLDGREVTPDLKQTDGTISINLPAGQHNLQIVLK